MKIAFGGRRHIRLILYKNAGRTYLSGTFFLDGWIMGRRKRTYVHVVPREDGWAVQSEGSSRPASVHDTQREAVEAAREMARNKSGELAIHGRDGRIRERDSYGSDPLPPREPREVLFPDRTITASKKAIREAVSAAMEESNGEPKRSSKSAKNADPPPPRG